MKSRKKEKRFEYQIQYLRIKFPKISKLEEIANLAMKTNNLNIFGQNLAQVEKNQSIFTVNKRLSI